MLRKIIILFLVMFCSSAYAEENDDSQYKDWNNIVSLLRSKGIIASKINWTEITAACISSKNKENENSYNKCLLNKAIDQNQYENDANYCNSEVQQKYFDYIKPSITTVTVSNSTANADDKKVMLTDAQTTDFKNSAYITCMRGVGWNNSNSWVNGRR